MRHRDSAYAEALKFGEMLVRWPGDADLTIHVLTTWMTQVFDQPGLGIVPDQFIPGPLFVGLGSDTDCDGTSEFAVGIEASNLADAWEMREEQWTGMTGELLYRVIPVATAIEELGDEFVTNLMDDPEFRYASLAWHPQPWCEDDSIGIPALDHTYDD